MTKHLPKILGLVAVPFYLGCSPGPGHECGGPQHPPPPPPCGCDHHHGEGHKPGPGTVRPPDEARAPALPTEGQAKPPGDSKPIPLNEGKPKN